ncbi:hypothetical protein SpCBS45565_g05790 [Spizellomyces sp. 'palustris']|nr:hypothetical protein SpCBS45565_g05790 [Spizellomyces sp. 'palustris']
MDKVDTAHHHPAVTKEHSTPSTTSEPTSQRDTCSLASATAIVAAAAAPIKRPLTACSQPSPAPNVAFTTSTNPHPRRPSVTLAPVRKPANPVITPGLRESKSISFFVDLTSPTTTTALSPPCSPSLEDTAAPPLAAKRSRTLDTPSSHPVPPRFPPVVRNRDTCQELAACMAARLMRAEARRAHVLQERRSRLRRRFEQVRYKILLQRQRDRLTSLKIQARSEYAISAANLKRQLILKRSIDRCGAAVEHAQTVAMVHKLRKFMELRRAFSENFVHLLAQSHMPVGGGADTVQTMSACHSFSLGMEADFDDEYYEMEDIQMQPPKSPIIGYPSPASTSPHVESPRGYEATLGGPDGDAVVSGSLRTSTTDAESRPSERAYSVVTDSVSNQPSDGNHSHLGDDSRMDMFDSLVLGGDVIGERLSATVRRLRVLPVSLVEDMEESAYMELLDLLPPITRFTLRELELTEILSNAQLRHDLFFDPELQFKPNLDGEKGEQKREAGDLFWTQVEEEVADGYLYRLPLLLFEIRCIILELLPYSPDRRDEVERNLDVRLIAQQMQHGVLNPLGLVEYIATLLKANCAPARDELVDSMVQECQGGNFVKALRVCFEVLELMKLDYANHQLHRVRPYVVEHAADFEWRWFKDQYETGAIKLDDTTQWFQAARIRSRTPSTAPSKEQPPSSVQHLHISATLHLISQSHLLSLPTNAIVLPETLRMDVSRLVQYYNDWQDITIMAALLVLFRQSSGPKCTAADLRDVKRVLWVLLNDSETSMHHVTLQMCENAGKIRGSPFSQRESDMLSGLVEKTLSPESKLYEVIRVRVGTVLERFVKGETVEKADLLKVGLAELEEEVLELGERIKRLLVHNWRVFGGVYAVIVEELQGGGEGLEKGMEAVLRT